MTYEAQIWGLVSDVHGNFPALELALHTLCAAGAQRLAFLGDYLGRGDSDRCVERIQQVADVAVVGNRDLDWQNRVSAASKAWVRELPLTAQVGELLMAHGDSRLTGRLSTAEINRDFVRTWPHLQRLDAQVFAFGHSHHARVWRKATVDQSAERVFDQPIALDAAHRYFVNVGTTGMPFPGKGGPSVALVDLINRTIRQLPLAQIAPE